MPGDNQTASVESMAAGAVAEKTQRFRQQLLEAKQKFQQQQDQIIQQGIQTFEETRAQQGELKNALDEALQARDEYESAKTKPEFELIDAAVKKEMETLIKNIPVMERQMESMNQELMKLSENEGPGSLYEKQQEMANEQQLIQERKLYIDGMRKEVYGGVETAAREIKQLGKDYYMANWELNRAREDFATYRNRIRSLFAEAQKPLNLGGKELEDSELIGLLTGLDNYSGTTKFLYDSIVGREKTYKMGHKSDKAAIAYVVANAHDSFDKCDAASESVRKYTAQKTGLEEKLAPLVESLAAIMKKSDTYERTFKTRTGNFEAKDSPVKGALVYLEDAMKEACEVLPSPGAVKIGLGDRRPTYNDWDDMKQNGKDDTRAIYEIYQKILAQLIRLQEK